VPTINASAAPKSEIHHQQFVTFTTEQMTKLLKAATGKKRGRHGSDEDGGDSDSDSGKKKPSRSSRNVDHVGVDDDEEMPLTDEQLDAANEAVRQRAQGFPATMFENAFSLYNPHFDATIPMSIASHLKPDLAPSRLAPSTPSTVTRWCCTKAVLQPEWGDVYPFRKVDAKSKAARLLRLTLARGDVVRDVTTSFSRKLATAKHEQRSVLGIIFGTEFAEAPPVSSNDHGDRKDSSTPHAPSLAEWVGAMMRYAEALVLVHPDQGPGMQDYIRFAVDVCTVVP